MREIPENFYEVHWRDSKELCYVRKSEEGTFFGFFPDGRILPILESPGSIDYILLDNLSQTPVDPSSYLKSAEDMVRFIYTSMGRLRAQQSKLEASALRPPSRTGQQIHLSPEEYRELKTDLEEATRRATLAMNLIKESARRNAHAQILL